MTASNCSRSTSVKAAYCEDLPAQLIRQSSPPEAIHRVRDHALDVGFDGDVRANEAGMVPERTLESLAPFLSPARDHDPGALADEDLRGTGADAARCARDDCDFSGQCHDVSSPDFASAKTTARPASIP
jgi:hypothetical protein